MKSDLEQVWKGLSSPIRRRILDLLRNGPSSTGELADAFPELSRFAVMQHLGVLEEAGLVLVRREGRSRLNYLNSVPLRMIYERWVSEHAGMAAETAFRLKQFIERPSEGDNKSVERTADRVVKVEVEIRIEAPPERVFAALTEELDSWWPFRFKPNGKMVVECGVGGRWYEDWGNGHGAHHATIVWWEPPFKYAAAGPGAMANEFQAYDSATIIPDGDGSIYQKSLTLWGAVPDEVEKMFRDGSKAIHKRHLKAYLEEGVRYTPGS
jgi:DNA-binding transcriptional ArsR family regulator